MSTTHRPSRTRRWLPALAAAVALGTGVGAAHAGDVRWSIGLNLPLPPLPHHVIRHSPVYAPPVVYAPPRAYVDVDGPGADYGYGPSYGPAYGPAYGSYRPSYRPSYGPEVVTYERYPRHARHRGYRHAEPAVVYVQPRVIVRPAPPRRHWDRGGY